MVNSKITGIPLSLPLRQLMVQLSDALGVKEFILFGGAAMDLLVTPTKKIRDLDIGIEGGEIYIQQCKKQLKRSGYQIIGKDRPYFINVTDPVTMVFAKNNRWTLDISFMNNVSDVGQFDIESLFFRYPELDYIDRYGALKALREKTMQSIRSLYKENPYLLINRIINMCAKYNMSLSNNSSHRRSISILKKRIATWQAPNKFHGQLAKVAHYSTVLKAIKRAKDRCAFIEELVSTDLLSYTIPEIQKPLRMLSPQQEDLLEKVKTKTQIANFLLNILTPESKAKLRTKFQKLHLREWDLEDKKLNLA